MVVTDLPFASAICVWHDLVASPSRWIVQAPQAATPQPNFVPVGPGRARKYQSTGSDGSPSNDCACPLTCRVIMLSSRLKAAAVKSCRPAQKRVALFRALKRFPTLKLILSHDWGGINCNCVAFI